MLQFTKTKAVFEEEQRKDDLAVDLNNNSEHKTEALKPQLQRKAKFGPFEPSFEEEDENHKEPFTNNLLDYFGHRDCVTF